MDDEAREEGEVEVEGEAEREGEGEGGSRGDEREAARADAQARQQQPTVTLSVTGKSLPVHMSFAGRSIGGLGKSAMHGSARYGSGYGGGYTSRGLYAGGAVGGSGFPFVSSWWRCGGCSAVCLTYHQP